LVDMYGLDPVGASASAVPIAGAFADSHDAE
jgi:hypothetical protein